MEYRLAHDTPKVDNSRHADRYKEMPDSIVLVVLLHPRPSLSSCSSFPGPSVQPCAFY